MNIRFINVFPDDFIGFRSFFEFELNLAGWLIIGIGVEIMGVVKFFFTELVDDFALVIFGVHDNDNFLALDVVAFNIAFQSFDFGFSMLLGFVDFFSDFVKFSFVVFFNSLEFLFLQFTNCFFVFFYIFVFKNIYQFFHLFLFIEFFFENFQNLLASAIDLRHTAHQDWVVRQRTRTLIIVLFLLDYHISDADKGYRVNQKWYYSQKIVLVLVLADEHWKVYHATCAMCLMVVRLWVLWVEFWVVIFCRFWVAVVSSFWGAAVRRFWVVIFCRFWMTRFRSVFVCFGWMGFCLAQMYFIVIVTLVHRLNGMVIRF